MHGTAGLIKKGQNTVHARSKSNKNCCQFTGKEKQWYIFQTKLKANANYHLSYLLLYFSNKSEWAKIDLIVILPPDKNTYSVMLSIDKFLATIPKML